MHKCWNGEEFEKHIKEFDPDKAEAWCGSNWDAFGNPRFNEVSRYSSVGPYIDTHNQDKRQQTKEGREEGRN